MNPFRVFLMLLLTLILTLGCAMIFPEDGFTVAGIHFTFFKLEDLAEKKVVEIRTIEQIIPEFSFNDVENDTSLLMSMKPEENTTEIAEIEMNDEVRNEFRTFFEKLHEQNDTKPTLRILHYGDSQIEGDRITSIFRNKMQETYGGVGVGLIPIDEPTDSRMSMTVEKSDNWERKQVFGSKSRWLKSRKYGVMGYVHFLKPDPEKMGDTVQGWAKFKPNKMFYRRAAQYNNIKLIYQSHGTISLSINDSVNTLVADSFPRVYSFDCSNFQPPLLINFKSNSSMRILGIAFDGKGGVTVDNLSMRGSSGTEFTKLDMPFARKQYVALNVGMIIYQFGVNVVPYIKDNVEGYGQMMKKQLIRLKTLNPGIPILVIGTSDMAQKEGSNYVSYPNIIAIRDMQKKIALETGCGFWDLLEVMGGENSMPAWVFADPPLAGKDFLHFTPKGANIIGHKLFESIRLLDQTLTVDSNPTLP